MNSTIKKYLVAVLVMSVALLGTASVSFAQQLRVHGVVVDDSGTPVMGAAVMVPGTTTGTTTDIDGVFSLSVAKGTTLEVSCIGYASQSFAADSESEVRIVLHEDNEFLEETVVIGYSVQKKSNVTGAIAAVKSNDLNNRSTENAGAALQGKLAGLQVLTNSSAPGASTTFRIRGYSSTSGKSDPLYLVDGLKVTSIDYLNTENIESIEILKDAASAAIYGAEAGNGVVLITTKNGGQVGSTRVFYNAQLALSSQARRLKMMDADEFKDYWKRSGRINNDVVFGPADTDWQGDMLETGLMHKHTVGVQAQNTNGGFYVALTYHGQDGIITGPNDVNNSISAQVNADYKIRPWLKVGTTNTIERGKTISVSEQSNHAGLAQSIFYYDPTVPAEYENNSQAPASLIQAMQDGNHVFYGPNGNLRGVSQLMTSTLYNPWIMLEYESNKTWRTNVNGTIYADITPLKNLVLTTKVGYRIGNVFTSNYTSPFYLTPKQVSAAPSLSSANRSSVYYQWENYANYNISLGRHDLAFMAGMQYADNRTEYVSGYTNELKSLNERFRYLDYSTVTASNRIMGGSYYNRRNISYFGRIGYTFADKYMLQVNFRADAFDSSKLSAQNRWGYFPSVSAGWTVSNEEFMKNIIGKTLSFLKIRASWGINGNVNSLNNFPYTAAMVVGPPSDSFYGQYFPGSYYNYDNTGLVIGTAPATTLANPKLSWEESRQVDAGVDARFFDNRLTLAYDFYYKRTTGMLGTISAPFISGCSTQIVNAGKIDNWGHEIELSWKHSLGDFSYGIDANASTVKNIVRESPYEDGRYYSAGNKSDGYYTVLEAGYPMWYLRLHEVDHVDPSTGVQVYTPGETEGDAADGRVAYTNVIPHLTYGITLSLNYKNFDFIMFGNGVNKADKFMNIFWTSEPMINMPKFIYDNTWSSSSKDSRFGIPSITDTNFGSSDTWVFDASYFKIKQIQLGYSFPSSLLKRAHVEGLRVYASLDDFFTFTKYPGDPESRSNFGQMMAIDNVAYPSTKRVMFGINLTF